MKPRQPPTSRPPLARAIAARSLALLLSLSLIVPPVALAQQARGKFRGGDAVTLNFVNADIEGVTRAMAAILKQQFVVDPRVKGTITRSYGNAFSARATSTLRENRLSGPE